VNFDSRVEVVQPFTSDRGKLEAIVRHVHADDDRRS
jgi:hypothetical protein